MKAALPSFSNRPILAYIYYNEVTGQDEFYTHNMHQDEDGNIVYDEIPVGIIPESCNAHLEYDEKLGHNYVVVDGYLFDEYTKAKDILSREKKCACSVELSIKKMSYNAKEKYLNIEDFLFSGVSILGRDTSGKEVKPGMESANIALKDFSVSVFDEEELVKRVEELEKNFASFAINDIWRKEEGAMDDLQKETKEEIVEAVEETAFAVQEETAEPVVSDYSRLFEISHEDIKCALYNLIPQDDWYAIVNVFDDHFVYHGLCEGKIFGQKYVKDGDEVSLDGDRWELFAEYLTESEKNALELMRASYAEMQERFEAISSKLAKYEAEPEKMSILMSTDYTMIECNEDFKNLMNVENHFDLSVEEVKQKADEILLSCAKNNSLAMPVSEQNVERKKFAAVTKKVGRYGNMFSR